jgi:hypothetical protein
MPTYVYGCKNHPAQRLEVIHSIQDVVNMPCPECQTPMHRIPQRVRFYHNPLNILYDKLDTQYRAYRARKAKERAHA